MASGWAWIFYFVLCVQSIGALQFSVGGYKGWGLISGQPYNQWAGKNRFQIGDTLLFKYNKSMDSVLQVNAKNYNICNTTSPIKSFKDGNTIFKLDRHGAFYFISGNSSNCQKGERLIVVVLSPNPSPKTSPSPSPKTSHSPSLSPKTSPSPSPRTSLSPSSSPSPSPSSSHGFSPSPTPISSPSLSPKSSSPSTESPQIITPSSSLNITSPAPAPSVSASSSSATSLANLVIPFLLLALLKPNL